MQEEKKDEHPSYGIISVSRINSNPQVSLFGSSIKHSNYISLTISKAYRIRNDLNYDNFISENDLIEINMSQSQFLDMITNMNHHPGIPVTINYINGTKIEDCPYVSKIKEFQDEFKQVCVNLKSNLNKDIKDILDIINLKNSLSKTNKHVIINALRNINKEISENIPFIASQFVAQLDKTISEAKNEVDNYTKIKLMEAGIEKFSNDLEIKLLENDLQENNK